MIFRSHRSASSLSLRIGGGGVDVNDLKTFEKSSDFFLAKERIDLKR
jgi:hypothetical protein